MKKIVISKNIILLSLLISTAYYVVIMFLTNKDLLIDFSFFQASFITKLQLLLLILFPWGNLLNPDLLLLSLVALLTGTNLSILLTEFKLLSRRKAGLFSGGSSILGVASASCILVCSTFPFLFAVSLTGTSFLLPLFENLKYISPLLLSLSLYIMLKNYKATCNTGANATPRK